MADDVGEPRLRLVSDRAKSSDWESFDRRTIGPRYRQGLLAPWSSVGTRGGVHIPEAESVDDGKES
jgi:hypothetical protein